jgi:hypothetical protein
MKLNVIHCLHLNVQSIVWMIHPIELVSCRFNVFLNPLKKKIFLLIENAFRFDLKYGLQTTPARLSQKTICMIAIQGDPENPYYHYDVHNLFGHTQAIATNKYIEIKKKKILSLYLYFIYNLNRALKNIDKGKRPFVLSRSTYVGSGHYAGSFFILN